MADAEVIIIGGGIAGASAAFHLAGYGRDVILLERGEIASEASGVNAGGIGALGWGNLPDLESYLTMGSLQIFRSLQLELGYDIESRIPGTGRLRFIEVKGRRSDAQTITVTRNEILYSLNKPDDFILAIVEFRDDDTHRVRYVRRPFQREPDFDAASVNYGLQDLLARGKDPR